ncbi:MAG: hypothetical protein K2W95_18155 [Candidatus Obscuribacterales bacterium]|nr:hypothetical protein [Candidatus Obscuribacterales bacterium]
MLLSRTQSGQCCTAAMVVLLLSLLLLGGLTFDGVHLLLVKEQLQQAVDAAAIAGAHHLPDGRADAEASALYVLSRHILEGGELGRGLGRTAEILALAPFDTNAGSVQVKATLEVPTLTGGLTNCRTIDVSASALAGSEYPLRRLHADQAFPLAVSLDRRPLLDGVYQPALNSKRLGDEFILYLGPNAAKNADLIGFDGCASKEVIEAQMRMALGLNDTEHGVTPSVSVGQQIYLTNGILGKDLIVKSDIKAALLSGAGIIVPAIEGEPPYNQQTKVVGFVGLKILAVKFQENASDPMNAIEEIHARIEHLPVRGETGFVPVSASSENAVRAIGVYPVQLLE